MAREISLIDDVAASAAWPIRKRVFCTEGLNSVAKVCRSAGMIALFAAAKSTERSVKVQVASMLVEKMRSSVSGSVVWSQRGKPLKAEAVDLRINTPR